MLPVSIKSILLALVALCVATTGWGQTWNSAGSPSQGLRVAQAGTLPSTGGPGSTSGPVMVPLNPGGSMGFDPYAAQPGWPQGGSATGAPVLPPAVGSPTTPSTIPSFSAATPGIYPANPGYSPVLPSYVNAPNNFAPGVGVPGLATPGYAAPSYGSPTAGVPSVSTPGAQGVPLGGIGAGSYPSYTGPSPILPGAGQSAIVNTNPAVMPNNYSTTGLYPNSTPSALFPGSYNYSNGAGNWFSNPQGGSPNSGFGGTSGWPGGYGASPYGQYGMPGYPNGSGWDSQGSMFGSSYGQSPSFIRLFQGPRIRHAYIHGNNDHNALGINDTDVAIALVIPNALFSNQPLYLLPSFSLHLWDGPNPTVAPGNTADLPPNAFSAFLDTGWQSDPNQIFGAELGLRVGVFSDFNAISSDSIRVMGRGIGRIRMTPQATLKLGVFYLDRNRVEFLPAVGVLFQPNPTTRLDLFFPEPKLSAFLTTLGNKDLWWYVAGYYGGGNWTVERTAGTQDSVDINDVRIVAGLEWGQNEMMRDGRRTGFAEFGYVFERELLYKRRPIDNLDLQNNFVIRVGLGY